MPKTVTYDKYGRPRDNQKQRLYDAEGMGSGVSPAGRRLLYGGSKVRTTGSISIEACQNYVDYVTTSAWFQRRWGRRKWTVKHKVSGSATGQYGYVTLPPWARNEETILHEIAHTLCPPNDERAVHGPEFAGVLLTLVKYQLGQECYKRMRQAFRDNKVRSNFSMVPAPKLGVEPRSKVEAEKTARKRREAEYAKRRELTNARQAGPYVARTLRILISDGAFGPAGSTDRKHALGTARALEKVK